MGGQQEEGRHERIGKSSKEDRKHEVREKEGNLGNVPFDPVYRFRLTFGSVVTPRT